MDGPGDTDPARRYSAIGLSVAGGIVAVIVGAAAWVNLRGDDPPAPVPTSGPTSRTSGVPTGPGTPATPSTPGVVTTEQAVTEAQSVYRRYVAVMDQIAGTGGRNTTGLDAVAIQEARRAGQNLAALYSGQGFHSLGSTAIMSVNVASVRLDTIPPEVVLNGCEDQSGVSVVDRAGSTTPAARPRTGVQVVVVRTTSGQWVVARVENKAVPLCD